MTDFGLEVEVIEKDAERFDPKDFEEFEDELAPQVKKSDSAINFGR